MILQSPRDAHQKSQSLHTQKLAYIALDSFQRTKKVHTDASFRIVSPNHATVAHRDERHRANSSSGCFRLSDSTADIKDLTWHECQHP